MWNARRGCWPSARHPGSRLEEKDHTPDLLKVDPHYFSGGAASGLGAGPCWPIAICARDTN